LAAETQRDRVALTRATQQAEQEFAIPQRSAVATLSPQNVLLDGKPAIVLHDNQGNYFDRQTKLPVTGRVTPYIQPPTPRAKGDITPNSEANLVSRLSTQWGKASKDVQELYRANTIMSAGMDAARKGDLNAGSQAVLITFQKFLDPQSVVRESEYSRSAEGLSMANRIRGYVGRLQEGGAGLPLAELETFAALAKNINDRLANEGKSLLSEEKARIGRTADRYGIPNDLIFPAYDYAEPAPVPSANAGGGGGASVSAPIVQRSPSSGAYRYSTDGGKTWLSGQPPK
jgi:hypothetical protein